MKKIRFKLNKKKWIIIGVIILSPVIVLILSFTFGKILLAFKRAELQKAGIPTNGKEYDAKCLSPVHEKQNGFKVLKDAFELYKEKPALKYKKMILDQAIPPELLKAYNKNLSNNKAFLNEVEKLNNYNTIRFGIACYDLPRSSFSIIESYYSAKIEVKISQKRYKEAAKTLKSVLHLKTLSLQGNYLDNFNIWFTNFTIIPQELSRYLSIVEFSQNDLKDFIKIFNKQEKSNIKHLKNEYTLYIKANFLSTSYGFVKRYFKYTDYDSRLKKFGFLYKHKKFLALAYYYSGLNSYDAVNAIDMNVRQQKIFPLPYSELIKFPPIYRKKFRSYCIISADAAAGAYNLNKSFFARTAKLRCAKAACAIELFRRKYNKLPTSLKQLVPDCISDVPVDPYNGQELKYKIGSFNVAYPPKIIVKKSGYYIYSVGSDLRDNNGRAKDIVFPVVVKTK